MTEINTLYPLFLALFVCLSDFFSFYMENFFYGSLTSFTLDSGQKSKFDKFQILLVKILKSKWNQVNINVR